MRGDGAGVDDSQSPRKTRDNTMALLNRLHSLHARAGSSPLAAFARISTSPLAHYPQAAENAVEPSSARVGLQPAFGRCKKRDIRASPQKLNMLCRQIRGMRASDTLRVISGLCRSTMSAGRIEMHHRVVGAPSLRRSRLRLARGMRLVACLVHRIRQLLLLAAASAFEDCTGTSALRGVGCGEQLVRPCVARAASRERHGGGQGGALVT